jgi:hypothetical protein
MMPPMLSGNPSDVQGQTPFNQYDPYQNSQPQFWNSTPNTGAGVPQIPGMGAMGDMYMPSYMGSTQVASPYAGVGNGMSPNPADVLSSYNPATDPFAGFVNQPAGGAIGAGGNSAAAAAAINAAGNNPSGNSSIPWDKIFDTSLGNRQLDQQQQWLNYQMQQWLPAQLQMQQAAAKIQNQLNEATATGDYNGQQTLQAQLQQVNENLANYQANINGMIAQSGLSGVYNGNPTLQAQNLMNQFAATGGNQMLTARGQDLGYDQALMNFATQQGQLQEQLATSPLVAWYTARGLPPPTSAFMGQGGGSGNTAGQSTMPTFMQLYNSIPQFQGLGQYQAPNYSWNFPSSGSNPTIPYLPTQLTAGNGTASNVTAP